MAMEFDGRIIETDDEGYLLHREDMTDDLMRHIALNEMGLELSDDHLAVIRLVRAYFDEYESTPPMRGLIKALKNSEHAHLTSSVALARLFPDGAAKCAAKLAGLPKPLRCV